MTLRVPCVLAVALLACGGVKRVEQPAAAPQRPEAPDRREEGGVPPAPGRPRVPAAPEALLAPGAVEELQRALERRGLLGAHRAGELDQATSAAVRRFQEQQDLAATGMPDRETLSRLGIDPEAAYGRDSGR